MQPPASKEKVSVRRAKSNRNFVFLLFDEKCHVRQSTHSSSVGSRSMSSDDGDDAVFWDCHYCSGERGCPRASEGSIRCSAGRCKRKQAAERADAKAGLHALPLAASEPAQSSAAPRFCFQIKDVLGVSWGMDRLESKEKRVGRDREDEHLWYQVRGKFGDDSDEDFDDMVPDTKWVRLSELVEKIDEPGCAALDTFASSLQKAAKAARKRLRK